MTVEDNPELCAVDVKNSVTVLSATAGGRQKLRNDALS